MKTVFKKIKKGLATALTVAIMGTTAVPVQAAITPTVNTTKTVSSKCVNERVKMKNAAKKSYSKALPVQKKTTTTIKKPSEFETIKTTTTVVTKGNQTYKKGSKYKTVKKNITTTVCKTETVSVATQPNIQDAAPLMDKKVIKAFEKLGFQIKVDNKAPYTGYFTAKERSIIMREIGDSVYHELGHFLSFVAGNYDKSKQFAEIYNSEKHLYDGVNKAYVTRSASEYFAESVRDYTLNPTHLKSTRPMTYKAVNEAINEVTDVQIDLIWKLYRPLWTK